MVPPSSDEAAARRERWTLLSTLLFVLGGGVLCLQGFDAAVSHYYPELTERPLSDHGALFKLVVFPVLVAAVFALGALLGTVALLLVWRPFSTREQLEQLNQPRFPVISPLIDFVIGLLYPDNRERE